MPGDGLPARRNAGPGRRATDWMWPVMMLLVVLIQYVLTVGIWQNGERKDEARRLDDAAARVRLDNELRATVWASQAGVAVPPDGEIKAFPVKPWNLVEAFIGEGGYAYAGRMVAVPVRDVKVVGNEAWWFVGSDSKKPSLVFRFDRQPTVRGRAWIVGRVVGKESDGEQREHPGVNFVVIVVDCHAAGE